MIILRNADIWREAYKSEWLDVLHRFYSVEVSLSLVAHLTSSDPQRFATDPCSIHGGTNFLSFLMSFSFVWSSIQMACR